MPPPPVDHLIEASRSFLAAEGGQRQVVGCV